ncbi:MAG: (2Fe-2S)-binding protein [Deltaproteobacteria bacterium]|nr:(2Fe-2S)-binding protein [Deltaproteobacteria bacterium]
MSDTVTLTIDGQEVTVPKGTNVLEAARKLKINISYFCYHPGLSVAASCRQCLVEIVGQPKLAPSCQVVATDGMKVLSQKSDKVKVARQQMLEFTLVNHPVDCPICDKAGECTLQKHYFDWDAQPSRSSNEKVHKPKRVDVGPQIMLDAERCILCSRCIRVCDEVAGQHQLDMTRRGDREVISTAPGQRLDNPYSLNTVDVCPVGALTAKDFRFTLRAWELMMTPSVCHGCSTGCNIEIHHQEGKIYRLAPRENHQVNKYWMCDEGRFTYKSVHAGRLAAPVVDGLPSTWERALSAAAEKLKSVLDKSRDALGVVLSPRHGNEDNFVLARMARDFLGLDRLYVVGKKPVRDREDKILRSADVNPNTKGALAAAGGPAAGLSVLEKDLADGSLRGLLVLGADAPLSDEVLEKVRALDALVVIAAHEQGLAPLAHVVLPAADWAEVHGTITNREGRVQRVRAAFPPAGQALPAWEIAARLGRKLGATLEFPSPRAVFLEMTSKVTAFAGAEWGKEAPLVQLRFAGTRG